MEGGREGEARRGGEVEEGRRGLTVQLQHDELGMGRSPRGPSQHPLGQCKPWVCAQHLAPKEMFIPAAFPQSASAGRVTGPRPLTLQEFPERPPKVCLQLHSCPVKGLVVLSMASKGN